MFAAPAVGSLEWHASRSPPARRCQVGSSRLCSVTRKRSVLLGDSGGNGLMRGSRRFGGDASSEE